MMITGLMFRDGHLRLKQHCQQPPGRRRTKHFSAPDGDTGTNMSMTIGAAAKEMAVLPENCTVEEASSAAPLPCCGALEATPASFFR